ncbi:fimbria/pilus outer membrane usher protein [Pantoea sp. MBD-2R]|uniref:fimbria/pilus outer membrane usher protein n=1 Tax=Pantoea sp. MBD-2R TaxID=3141540 RepID=UPI0031835F9F
MKCDAHTLFRQSDKLLRAGLLPGGLSVVMLVITLSAQAELYFNVNALHLTAEQKSQLDLDLLSRLHSQMPGKYRVKISVNQNLVLEETLSFISCNERLCPILNVGLLKKLGVKVDAIAALAKLPDDAVINNISAVIPQAHDDFNFDLHTLKLSIPQAALNHQRRGDIPSQRWEEGLPMLFTSYSVSGSEMKNRSRYASHSTSSRYLNLRSGANLGPWRLRNYTYYSQSGAGKAEWNSMQTWLERDIRTLRSRLAMGDISSQGMAFDSVTFRGIALASQDEMLPYSQRGYAPEIHGVAMTNASVEVRQNDNLLYQTLVPPGEFIIKDLYTLGGSGDLVITVREEDGSERTTVQAYATPPISLRKDQIKYAFNLGEYGSRSAVKEGAINQKFMQSEMIYGLLNNTSLYGGLIAGEHYYSVMTGIGQGMGELGAVSLDVTQAQTHFSQGDKKNGQSWRLKYSKRLDSTDTTITLAGYRFATDGYYNFNEASDYYNDAPYASRYSLKNKAQLTLNQNIGELGSLSLSAWQQEYWHQKGAKMRAYTSSWNKNFSGVTVSLSQSHSKNRHTDKADNLFSASFSLPLGQWLSPQGDRSLRMSNRFSSSQQGGESLATTLSGSALSNNALSWSAMQARSQRKNNVDNSTALAASWQGSASTVSLGYANYYGKNERVNWAAQGAIVAHPYGVTLSRQLSEGNSYALVRAPGAADVQILNHAGVMTDFRGYAIIPSLTAYQENEVSLDTATLGDETDLTNTEQKKVPAREALVLMNFNTRQGHRVFLTINHKGKPLPLGALVSAGEVSGISNERGQVYLSGMPENVILKASLADGEICTVPFNAQRADKQNGIMMAELECEK